ncbi:hypothetical protein BDZ91DRAFT_766459 [Kalaharituber pfeilii]|nr:hypothetical protein BDZ91DRAFT_766459 [Kalaharituber pfeilii]
MDPSKHPKYNAVTGKIETRGRKPKPVSEPVHWKTQRVRDATAPKLINIMSTINEHFGSMRRFLQAWAESDDPKLQPGKQKFYTGSGGGGGGGGAEIVELWLGKSAGSGVLGEKVTH